ncbi:MAG: hypothetical protein KAJ65_08725, partial [Gammaproteobacteria bacterium]|nr:hypothetical protein [Gammaproteobacteria bacterium]
PPPRETPPSKAASAPPPPPETSAASSSQPPETPAVTEADTHDEPVSDEDTDGVVGNKRRGIRLKQDLS